MYKTKLLTGILLVLAVLFSQVGIVLAAPAPQETTTISGTIQIIQTETDQNGVTTVLVTLLDTTTGLTQIVRLSVETAAGIVTPVGTGLVTITTDANGNQVVTPDTSKINQVVDIPSTDVITGEEPTAETVHPIAAILAKFFGVEPSVVQGYHDDGYGFGVIAQAMWMAKGLGEGDMANADLILAAKKSGDYSAFTLLDGSTPTNWGQFKKAVMGKDKKNLGVIVSGHAETDQTQAQWNNGHGNGNGNGKDNNPGKGKDKNKNP
jgi:hypothetical protein